MCGVKMTHFLINENLIDNLRPVTVVSRKRQKMRADKSKKQQLLNRHTDLLRIPVDFSPPLANKESF